LPVIVHPAFGSALSAAVPCVEVAYAVAAVYAAVPNVHQVQIANVELSVPVNVNVLSHFNVLPAAIFNVFVQLAVTINPFVVVGVIAHNVRVIAGVVVAVATLPLTPLAVVTDTLVTVPFQLHIAFALTFLLVATQPIKSTTGITALASNIKLSVRSIILVLAIELVKN